MSAKCYEIKINNKHFSRLLTGSELYNILELSDNVTKVVKHINNEKILLYEKGVKISHFLDREFHYLPIVGEDGEFLLSYFDMFVICKLR